MTIQWKVAILGTIWRILTILVMVTFLRMVVRYKVSIPEILFIQICTEATTSAQSSQIAAILRMVTLLEMVAVYRIFIILKDGNLILGSIET